ncbi:Uracil-DNA glycosylase [Cohaesibacter sp. ES.047]|uniref:uracil-DNA glycosylase n=1 Tax=Cohaesibacter sp. ES.047 TaxID=1798205 RepID=UPI000BB6B626|nr:uracil-DNA glycosylase [Cohaesibacter sp. ES.047]SNY91564.1 Uracil-DNA glycosylase [Cohaesibacter sp. ES.047]
MSISLFDELKGSGGWLAGLSDQQSRLEQLESWLCEEEAQARILPERGQRLRALTQTPPDAVKVVITGQDPYPGVEGDMPHAMGLSFSVPRGIKPPRSLVNIYKELSADCGLVPPSHGDLSGWAAQGVLMLNSTLTLRQGLAASHAKKGWEAFTAAILDRVNRQDAPAVFLAWGRHSHKLVEGINEEKHCVIRTSHPSPLGARKAGKGFDAFLGSGCFSRANAFLEARGRGKIDWSRF